MARILIVDDDEDIVEMLKYNLEREDMVVETALNGRDALVKSEVFLPDLILLDVMMPQMDGIETCIELRKTVIGKKAMIAFLTARGEDYSQVAGLDAGADDYISKPIKPRVLISKINAMMRRQAPVSEAIKSCAIAVNREKYIALVNGKELSLPKKEFELLALLLSKPGRVFTREVILNLVWGQDIIVGDRTIDVHIRKLREKIGNNFIITVKGVGYKLEQ